MAAAQHERRDWDIPPARWVGANAVRLLQGGDELFPAICDAVDAARAEVWVATYLFDVDAAARGIAAALCEAASRGVAVHLVVDGFGSKLELPALRRLFDGSGVGFEVFRPVQRWWQLLQPGQLRRLHHKLCAIDDTVAFVGGINVIDDRHDLRHGVTDQPRLDFAVELRGPLAASVAQLARAMFERARFGHDWRDEVRRLASSKTPVGDARRLMRQLRSSIPEPAAPADSPVRAALVVRDNLRQRRAIEHRYIAAIRDARERVDIACPYFYPRRAFRRALRESVQRGVRVRLLLQGKVDYRIAALAAQALYDELRGHGVRIFEYLPAFLHAKVACVDDDWATVGSSNIDPLSLLMNLEANVVVRDADFTAALMQRLDAAFAAAREITAPLPIAGWRRWLRRGFVAWVAGVYLRLGGVAGRY